MANKVLVVDDERIVCRGLQKIIEVEGCEVDLASTGEEAISLAKNNKFKMAFVDLILPGIDGVEACKQLKKDNPDMKVILMSGYMLKFKEREKEFDSILGQKEVLEKPFGGDEVSKAVSDFFKKEG